MGAAELVEKMEPGPEHGEHGMWWEVGRLEA